MGGRSLDGVFRAEAPGAREEMLVYVEYRKDASNGLSGLKELLEARLKSDLGLTVEVKLVPEGELDQLASLGEGKAKRLIERRPQYRTKP